MSDDTKKDAKKSKKEPTFLEWLIHGKGTVSEPWPTAKELFEDQELQEEIKKVQNIVNNPKSSQNKIR